MGVTADLHQHLWPEPLLAALARRDAPPRLVLRGREWTLELAGEAPSVVAPADHDPVARPLEAELAGLDVVGIAPSSPLGIESLPVEEAQPLLDAFHDGVLELGAPFRPWAAPAWWPAMTSYVADMQAAWLAWAAWGRAAHPRLKVMFAMLAGGAPLHAERLAARGGPAGAVHDEASFYDVSSHGPRTVDAMLRVVGVDRLVHSSDTPVIDPVPLDALGDSVVHALTAANPARLLSLDPVPA